MARALAYCSSSKRHRVAWPIVENGVTFVEFHAGIPSPKKGSDRHRQIGIHGSTFMRISTEFPEGPNMYNVTGYCPQCGRTHSLDLEAAWRNHVANMPPLVLPRSNI